MKFISLFLDAAVVISLVFLLLSFRELYFALKRKRPIETTQLQRVSIPNFSQVITINNIEPHRIEKNEKNLLFTLEVAVATVDALHFLFTQENSIQRKRLRKPERLLDIEANSFIRQRNIIDPLKITGCRA